MTEATIVERMEVLVPGIEVVTLTLSDGETYIAKKLGRIIGATVSGNADNDAHINVTWSATTATVNYASQTDQKVTLVLYGQP